MPHRLLLADDSVTIQRVIELTFTEEDVTVTAVGDGQQAIDQISAEPPDIVLADVGMPEKTGYEVAEFVKGDPVLSRIPVILLTGAYEPVDKERAKRIGCDGVMEKPFEPQMVNNRVRDLLAGERPASLWTAPLDDEVSGVGAPATAPIREVGGPAAETTALAAASSPIASAAPAAPVSLAEAFAALLAAEQGWPSPPPTAGDRTASSLATERLAAAVTRRVLDQLTDQVVEDAVTREVSQVAERLVQDEIDRIKSDADAT